MTELLNTGQPSLSDESIEQMRAAILDTLEKTGKGGTVNSIQNCVIVFEHDPIFAGKISRNLLTETDDMIGDMPWQRTTTRFDDQDLPHVLLYFEQHYGIRSEKSIENAFRVVASRHSHHPIREHLRSLTWDGVRVFVSPCIAFSVRMSTIITKPSCECSCSALWSECSSQGASST